MQESVTGSLFTVVVLLGVGRRPFESCESRETETAEANNANVNAASSMCPGHGTDTAQLSRSQEEV